MSWLNVCLDKVRCLSEQNEQIFVPVKGPNVYQVKKGPVAYQGKMVNILP